MTSHLEIRDDLHSRISSRVRPVISKEMQPHYRGLARGQLLLPRCRQCLRFSFPVGPSCSFCRHVDVDWTDSTGDGEVHSWARYHRAFLEEFEPLVPYVVLAVRLKEGPVLLGLMASDSIPAIGRSARAVVERWKDGFCSLVFDLLPEGTA